MINDLKALVAVRISAVDSLFNPQLPHVYVRRGFENLKLTHCR